MFSGRYWSQIKESCRLLKTDLHHFRCPSFRNMSKSWSFKIPRFTKIICLKSGQAFPCFFWCSGVAKDKHSWCRGLVTGSKIPKSWTWWLFWFSNNNIEIFYTNSKQNNSPELLNLLFKHIFHKKWSKHGRTFSNNSPYDFPMISLWVSYDFRSCQPGLLNFSDKPQQRNSKTGYATTKTGYRTTPVGCRGGSRYEDHRKN